MKSWRDRANRSPFCGVQPNMRLKLAGGDRSSGSGVLCPGGQELSFNYICALRVRRPQLKRDPLGCTTVSGVRMGTGLTSLAALYVLVQCACAQARTRAVPFVGCAADGQQGHIAPPRGQPKAVDSSDVTLEGIAFYKGDYAPDVLAPSGW